MSRLCQICSHSKRLQIDRELVAGGNMTHISDRYDVPYSSVCNHRDNHLSRQLQKSEEIRQLTASETIAKDISSIYRRLNNLLDSAEATNHTGAFLDIAAEIRSYSEFLLKLQITFERLASEQKIEKYAEGVQIINMGELSDEGLKELITKLSKFEDAKERIIQASPIRPFLH